MQGGHLHASCSTIMGSPTASCFLMSRRNAKFNMFLQTSIHCQRKKSKHPGNNLCTGYHTPVKTKQVINLILKQYFSFQCQTSEQWEIDYCRGQRGEKGMRQSSLTTLQSHIPPERAWHPPLACTWLLHSPSGLLVVTRDQAYATTQLCLWTVSPRFVSLFLPLNLSETRRERTPKVLVIITNTQFQ